MAAILGTYPLYADPLFDKSVNTWIPNLQKRDNYLRKHVWNVFAYTSVFSIQQGPIVVLLSNAKDRSAAFYFVLAYVFQVILIGYL